MAVKIIDIETKIVTEGHIDKLKIDPIKKSNKSTNSDWIKCAEVFVFLPKVLWHVVVEDFFCLTTNLN